MTNVNYSIKLIVAIIVLLVTFSCAGGKEIIFEPNPPFEIKEVTAQAWVAGIQGGGSGTNLTLYLGKVMDELTIKDFYYREDVVKAERDARNIDKYVGRFLNKNNRDVIMDMDPIEEAKNTPPEKSPFSLDKNELVVSYFHEGALKFYQYTEVRQKPMIAYPGKNEN